MLPNESLCKEVVYNPSGPTFLFHSSSPRLFILVSPILWNIGAIKLLVVPKINPLSSVSIISIVLTLSMLGSLNSIVVFHISSPFESLLDTL